MKETQLFKCLPENLFSPLASKLKFIYSDVVFLIYKIVQNGLSYGIDKEIIIIEIDDYLSALKEDLILDEFEEAIVNTRDKANYIVRKLIEYGWIYSETTNDYKQIINFNDYAIIILESFIKIMNREPLEYQGNILSIYHMLYSTEKADANVIIRNVFDNTNEILRGLKTLNSNIKKYIDNLTKHKTPEEIMKTLFGEYTQNIIDKAYHRLMTSENISKYRPRIIERLEILNEDDNFIKEAAVFYKNEQGLDTLEAGVIKVKEIISEIIVAFNNLDDIIEEINNKNSKYQRAAVARAKFLLNNSKDVTGQIKTILSYASEQYKNLDLTLSCDYLDEIADLFTLYSYGYIDNTSLYVSNEGKKSFKSQKINANRISKEEREKKLQEFQEKQKRKFNIVKVNEIVDDLLKDKQVIKVDDINILTMEDFIKIIYIRLYSNSTLAKYKIKPINSIVESSGFKFRNFEIWRK